MNIGVHISFQTTVFVFFRYAPTSGMLVRREGWEPLPDKARESTLQSQSGGEKWLR